MTEEKSITCSRSTTDTREEEESAAENTEIQLPSQQNQIKAEKTANNIDRNRDSTTTTTSIPSSSSTTHNSVIGSSNSNSNSSTSTANDLLVRSNSNRTTTTTTFPRKSPLLKSNNNTSAFSPLNARRPSFPSLVIALLNTVRAGGVSEKSAGNASTTITTTCVKSEKGKGVEAADDACSNLNLNTLNPIQLLSSELNSTDTNTTTTKTEDLNGNEFLGENGESTPAIKLPENLEGLMRADHFPCQRHRWNTNEEIAAILISFAHHPEWLSKEVKIRPKSGSMLLYSRKKVRYRRDGYCWKKRKDGKTTREDHMKLKVQGTECIYGCYVHSAILPTFHRRCYWLLQNPDIVLVHYLNVPYPDDNKLIITSNVSMWGDKKEWTKEELISQLKPMFFSEEEPDLNNELELSTAETVEAIVMQLMEKQRLARQTASADALQVSVNAGNNSNSSSNNHGVVSVNGNLNGTTPSTVGVGGGGTARLSSSSSTSSLVQIPNIPSNGSSIVATVTTASTAIVGGNNGGGHGVSGMITTSVVNSKSLNNDSHPHHQQQHQQNNSTAARVATAVNLTATTGGNGAHSGTDRPFVLNLSQFQTAGGLIILNGKPTVTTPSGSVGVSQCHTATVQTTHHASALAAVQNLNNGSASLTSTLTASFMDVQNANENGNTSVGRVTNSTSNQTLLIHHSQNQQHFATALATAQQNLHHTHNSHNNHTHHHPQQSQQQQQSSHSQQHTVHHQPTLNNGSVNNTSGTVGGHTHNNHTGHGATSQHSSHQHHNHTQQQQQQQQSSDHSSGNQQHQQHQQQELLTLEMSHEDIQQTLSANMGMGDNTGDLEPMSPSADDVFVNLDAFDILADLSDDLDQSHHNGVLMGVVSEKTTIVDINPEWSFEQGGTKILIVGQFHNPHWDYSVHFGDLPVPAVYLQAGVLKCFCPPHSPGLVPIRVYSNGKQISNNSMVFEYKADTKVHLVPVPPSETSLKLCLIHRMECLEKCFHNFKGDEYGARSLEDSVVKMCIEMMSQEWIMGADIPFATLPNDRGMTLLHLAAALGYTRLVLTLIQWKRENPSNTLDSEVDPWKSDDFGLIPLMWCARHGHLESGVILSQYSPETLQKRGSEGLNPAQIAVARGHVKLASELEKIQNNRTGSEFGPGFGAYEELSLTSNLRRFQRCSSSISEDFGLKDCFFGQPDATSDLLSLASEEDSKVLTLAEQIIAAIPDRIKKESSEDMSPCESQDSSMMSSDHSETAEFSFEFSDRNYRYYDTGTPCSSLSPSSSCLQSPCSSSFTVDSPQPTTADFCEFLQASAFEKDFSNLTLSDREQRELYEAAKVIQKAYRSYKGRKKLEEEDKEKAAAIIIQNYYRRYKQYAYLRQVTQAALVIQSQYRNYCENKRFKKSQETDGGFRLPRDGSFNSMNSQHPILRTYSQRRQHQAAKKIQQFMRQSKNNLWETDESPKITERACRKREATMSMNHGILCPAPAKIALSSVQQKKSLQKQNQLNSAF